MRLYTTYHHVGDGTSNDSRERPYTRDKFSSRRLNDCTETGSSFALPFAYALYVRTLRRPFSPRGQPPINSTPDKLQGVRRGSVEVTKLHSTRAGNNAGSPFFLQAHPDTLNAWTTYILDRVKGTVLEYAHSVQVLYGGTG